MTLDSCLVTHRHLEHQANEEMDELHTPSPDQGPPGGVGGTRPTPRHHCSHHAKETRTLCSASWADKPVLWAPSCVRVWQSEHRNRKMRAPLTSCASWAVIVVVTLPLGSSVVEFCDPGCDVSAVWRRQHHSCWCLHARPSLHHWAIWMMKILPGLVSSPWPSGVPTRLLQ